MVVPVLVAPADGVIVVDRSEEMETLYVGFTTVRPDDEDETPSLVACTYPDPALLPVAVVLAALLPLDDDSET